MRMPAGPVIYNNNMQRSYLKVYQEIIGLYVFYSESTTWWIIQVISSRQYVRLFVCFSMSCVQMQWPYLCNVLKVDEVLWQHQFMIKHEPLSLTLVTITA